jgi:hypothetical protein
MQKLYGVKWKKRKWEKTGGGGGPRLDISFKRGAKNAANAMGQVEFQNRVLLHPKRKCQPLLCGVNLISEVYTKRDPLLSSLTVKLAVDQYPD